MAVVVFAELVFTELVITVVTAHCLRGRPAALARNRCGTT